MVDVIQNSGVILIGTSDSHGGIYDANGLDIAQIIDLKKNRKSLSEYV